jgi:hypothetical protein
MPPLWFSHEPRNKISSLHEALSLDLMRSHGIRKPYPNS